MNTPTQTQLLFERLSPRIGQALQLLPPTLWAQVQEVRLMQDKPIYLTLPGRSCPIDLVCPGVRAEPVTRQEIEQSFAALCEYSVHTYLAQIQSGYSQLWSGYAQLESGQQELAEGRELWYYTCIGPQGEYLNRFIPYHLIKTRLIPWYVYKIGATGYLHWGYCWWRTSDTFDSKQTGDEWLVRPDVENYDVFTSVRNEAQLDGIEDYELIRLLEAKDPEAARKLVDTMITDATTYSRDGESAMAAHKALLDLLTGQEAEPIAIPVFEDSFENGYDYAWKRQTGAWRVEESSYVLGQAGSNQEGMSTLREWTLANGRVAFTMEIGDTFQGDDTMWGGLTLRKSQPEDTMWQSGYTVYLRKNGEVQLIKAQPFAILGTAQAAPGADGSVRLAVSVNGDRGYMNKLYIGTLCQTFKKISRSVKITLYRKVRPMVGMRRYNRRQMKQIVCSVHEFFAIVQNG